MQEWLERLQQRPAVAHLMRAAERFTGRLGAQFSAGITYFSVLALVPLMMLGFSFVGFFLTQVRPDLIGAVSQVIVSQLQGVDEQTTAQIDSFIVNTLSNYGAIGVVGLLSALYAGANWMNNLKDALDAQWRGDFDNPPPPPNLVAKTLTSLLALIGLIIAIVVTFGLAAISTALADVVIGWLGLTDVPGISILVTVVPVVFSLAAGWLTFCYIYTVLPYRRESWRVVRKGALLGSIGLAVLQYLASFLFGVFSGNVAAQFFGPIIVLMLFFNFFATLILFVAAWIATAENPAFAPQEDKIRFALTPTDQPEAEEERLVPEAVAVRSVKAGAGVGYLTGAATGIGLGAIFALIAGLLGRRRR